jgi:hypothetical protein
VPFTASPDCPSDVGSAQVYVLDGVSVETPSPQDLYFGGQAEVNVSLATTGWISSVHL